MEYTLSMVFKTEYGLTSTLSISGVKSTITQADVDTLMDIIIAKNIFLSNSGALVSKDSAQVVAKTITKYDVA
ncbi:MAG: DUF2922 domain-containing protein [Clostridium sp.]|uniref:DUF2922 domain-containing protein n=1 Tax=Clostridium sp. TaxID=1506 RepID=UPI0025B8F2A7|nr:DUF2922 domain-containing protein [Clostridium sp.]MCE5222029.1 DUF2922 domain-containing protein [Clostridium sp.]